MLFCICLWNGFHSENFACSTGTVHSKSLIHVLAECMCWRTGLPFKRASTGYSNGLAKISWVSEIANAKSYTRSRLIPAIRIHRAPLGWEAALLENDSGLLVDSQLDTSHWHHWRMRALWSKKKTAVNWCESSRGHHDSQRLEVMPVRSGQGTGAYSSQRWNCCREDFTAASQSLVS